MEGCGTVLFTDPADYQASVGGVKIDFAFGGGSKDFKARLTWAKLPHTYLLRGEENQQRIGFVALEPRRLFVGFPTNLDPPPIWDGVELQPGDILFDVGGERVHQRTRKDSQWAFMSLEREYFAAFSKALLGRLVAPAVGRIIRPPRSSVARLLRLHAKVCRLAESEPKLIAHREVARSMEHDLLYAVVDCLGTAAPPRDPTVMRRHIRIMGRFEDEVAAHINRPTRISEVCAAIDVPERTLRECCAQFLGVSPNQYLRLRRLNMARAALRRADPATASIAEIASRYGFREPGRFAVSYRYLFGETPSSTLRPVEFA